MENKISNLFSWLTHWHGAEVVCCIAMLYVAQGCCQPLGLRDGLLIFNKIIAENYVLE